MSVTTERFDQRLTHAIEMKQMVYIEAVDIYVESIGLDARDQLRSQSVHHRLRSARWH